VFADNGSTDGTESWVKENYPEAVYVSVPRTPEGGCRAKVVNMGVAAASGGVAVVQGGEMLYQNNPIPLILQHFEEHTRGIVVTPYAIIYEQFGVRPHEESHSRRFSLFAIHRDDFIEIGGQNEHYIQWGNEDIDFHVRCEAYGYKMIEDPRIDVRHYAHESSGGDAEKWAIEHEYMKEFTAKVKAGKASPVLPWGYTE